MTGPLAAPALQVVEENLLMMARRIARNREIAGLHYPTDSAAGATLAGFIFDHLWNGAVKEARVKETAHAAQENPPPVNTQPADPPPQLFKWFQDLVEASRREWSIPK